MQKAFELETPTDMRLHTGAFWSTNRQRQQANRALPESRVVGASLPNRASVLQWTAAGAVGLGLGIYFVVTSSVRPDRMQFFALAALVPFLAMIVGDVRKFLLATILVEIPVQFDKFLYYDWDAASLGAIGGFNVSLTTFCLAALYALWMVELLAKVTPVHPSWFRASLPLAAYLAAATLSVVVARSVNLAVFELFLLSQSFLLYLYIIKALRSRQDVLFIVTMLLIGLAFHSAVMIGLRIIGHSVSIARIYAYVDASGRVGGTIGTPNTAAGYLTLLLAPALCVLMTSLGRRYKLLAALSFGLGAAALLFTFSRGGWLACALSVALLCLAALQRGWLSPRVSLTVAIVVALLFLLFGAAVLGRLTGDDAGAAASRIVLERLALRMIRDHPLLGVGANNFGTMVEQYVTAEFFGAFVYTAHNKYLLVWAEMGIIGLLTFLGFLLVHIRRGWQGWMQHDRLLSPLALGFTVAIVGQMAHMLLDVFHSRPQVQMLWLVAGIITAMHTMGAKELHSRRKGGV